MATVSNLTAISAYNPRSFFSMSAIFRRAAEKLDIQDAASEDGCRLASIVSTMRLGVDDVEKLADNAANVYRGDRVRRSSQFGAPTSLQPGGGLSESSSASPSGLSDAPSHGPHNHQR